MAHRTNSSRLSSHEVDEDRMKMFGEIIGWTIVAAVIVLVVMNASNVATVVTSIGSFWGSETSMFTGSGYNTANYGVVKH